MSSLVTESSIVKSGLTFCLGLGRRLHLPTFRGVYPTTKDGIVGGIGGFSIGGVAMM